MAFGIGREKLTQRPQWMGPKPEQPNAESHWRLHGRQYCPERYVLGGHASTHVWFPTILFAQRTHKLFPGPEQPPSHWASQGWQTPSPSRGYSLRVHP